MWKFARSCTVAVVGSGYHAHTRLLAAQMTKPSNSLLCRLIQNGSTNKCQSIEKTGRLVQRGAEIAFLNAVGCCRLLSIAIDCN